jgi:hypothetical protein
MGGRRVERSQELVERRKEGRGGEDQELVERRKEGRGGGRIKNWLRGGRRKEERRREEDQGAEHIREIQDNVCPAKKSIPRN